MNLAFFSLRPNRPTLLVARRAFATSLLVVGFTFAPFAVGLAATLDVTTTTTSGAGSLRDQIASAATGDVINLTATGTIALTTGEIIIAGKDLTIAGPGAEQLTITTNATTRALHFVNSASTINGLTFQNCKGLPGDVDTGGAIMVDNFTSGGGTNLTTITDCAFLNNQSGWGGALDIFHGGLVLSGCTFEGNTCTGLAFSTNGGGGALSLGPTVASTITNCTFSANSQTGAPAELRGGGAIYNYGAVATTPPPVVIEHCTFVGNVDAAGAAGAIKGNFTGSYTTMESLRNSLLVDNQAPSGTLLNFAGNPTGGLLISFSSQGGNVTDEHTSSSQFMSEPGEVVNNAAVAASVLPLANNGGSTKTHALTPGSPAQGKSTASAVAVDQRGAGRHPGSDAGAYELIEPELEVRVAGVAIVYRAAEDFGSTIVGSSVTKTVTVANVQTSPFVASPLEVASLSLPPGFVETGFAPVSLGNGESAAFDLTLPATNSGAFSGPMILASNDGYNPDLDPGDPLSESLFVLNLSGSVTVLGSPIEQWRQLHFGAGASNSGDAADEANPSGDGIPNLVKYALGLNPLLGGGLGSGIVTDLNSEGFLSMTVTKNPSASDVTLSLEVTGDLSDWSADGVTIDEDTAIMLRGHDNTPIGSAERRFIRLNVTRR